MKLQAINRARDISDIYIYTHTHTHTHTYILYVCVHMCVYASAYVLVEVWFRVPQYSQITR